MFALFGAALADPPDQPTVDLTAISNSQVVVDITPPLSDGGSPIISYKVSPK